MHLGGEENAQPFYCIIAMMVVSMMLFQLTVALSSIQFATDAGSTSMVNTIHDLLPLDLKADL